MPAGYRNKDRNYIHFRHAFGVAKAEVVPCKVKGHWEHSDPDGFGQCKPTGSWRTMPNPALCLGNVQALARSSAGHTAAS